MPDQLLETLQPNERVLGYHLNRVIDALNGRRSADLAVVEVPANAETVGGVRIDGMGITFYADGTMAGIPAGTITIQSNINGQFQSANNWPLCWGYQPVDGTYTTRNRWWFTNDIQMIFKVFLVFTTQPFHVGQQAASTETTVTGVTTNAVTSDAGTAHSHTTTVASGTAGNAVTLATANTLNATGGGTITSNTESAHTHNVPGQTLDLTIPSTNLSVPTAIYEAGMAQGCHLFIDGVDQTTAFGGPFGTGATEDFGPFDITQYLATPAQGWHEINISSTTIGGVTATIYTKSIIVSL